MMARALHNCSLPDENGVELFWDRPEEQWPRPADGSPGVAMITAPLDVQTLLAELEG
jgi:catechol 2,3-dioxygenase